MTEVCACGFSAGRGVGAVRGSRHSRHGTGSGRQWPVLLIVLLLCRMAWAEAAVDEGFNPGGTNVGKVLALAVQADGKVVVGGTFVTLGGQPRRNIGRLDADGSLDSGFNPGADGTVNPLALQANGKTVVGGTFRTLGGASRSNIGRLDVAPSGASTAGCQITAWPPDAYVWLMLLPIAARLYRRLRAGRRADQTSHFRVD